MLELLTTENLVALLTLTTLEIVLGIDNIVFISILSAKLPEHQRAKARRIGLFVAMLSRIGLLLSLSWIMTLIKPLFDLPTFGLIKHVDEAGVSHDSVPMTGKSMILLIGGLVLILKSTKEIHHKLDGHESPSGQRPDPARGITGTAGVTFASVLAQVVIIDLVFSLDSVITAVGMTQSKPVMITAVLIAVIVMMLAVNFISDFVEKHPTVKMLALSFLLLIGVLLLAEAFHQKIPKGYVYFAMAFSLGVEMLNIRAKKGTPAAHA
jgi:predicted tellurium resistance membrane protein TerC